MKRKDTGDWQDQIKVDFAADSGSFANELRERLLLTLDCQADDYKNIGEGEPMKKTLNYSARIALIAALAIVLISASALAMATVFKLGPFATYTQSGNEEAEIEMLADLFDEYRADWEGKLYDKQGKLIDDLFAYVIEGRSDVYDADGNKVTMNMEDGKLVFGLAKEAAKGTGDVQVTKFATLEAVQPYMSFEVSLPTFLPDGYALDHFELFGEPEPDEVYLTVIYAKPDVQDSEIHLMLALMNEETAFEMSTSGEVRSIKVGKYDAIVSGKILDVLIGDVLYTYFPLQSAVSLDELIQMAESITE